jgi:hypothetical protein
MVIMNFKKFKKKDESRSLLIETPKLLKKHALFFNQIKQEIDKDEYDEWEAEAVFFLFLKPNMDTSLLRPENIEKYSDSVLSAP